MPDKTKMDIKLKPYVSLNVDLIKELLLKHDI